MAQIYEQNMAGLLKSFYRRRQERRQEMEMINMFMTNISRKRVFQELEEDELAMAEALGLCAVANKKPRKERTADEERSNLWWRNGYQNWDDEAFKKRLRINRATFQRANSIQT